MNAKQMTSLINTGKLSNEQIILLITSVSFDYDKEQELKQALITHYNMKNCIKKGLGVLICKYPALADIFWTIFFTQKENTIAQFIETIDYIDKTYKSSIAGKKVTIENLNIDEWVPDIIYSCDTREKLLAFLKVQSEGSLAFYENEQWELLDYITDDKIKMLTKEDALIHLDILCSRTEEEHIVFAQSFLQKLVENNFFSSEELEGIISKYPNFRIRTCISFGVILNLNHFTDENFLYDLFDKSDVVLFDTTTYHFDFLKRLKIDNLLKWKDKLNKLAINNTNFDSELAMTDFFIMQAQGAPIETLLAFIKKRPQESHFCFVEILKNYNTLQKGFILEAMAELELTKNVFVLASIMELSAFTEKERFDIAFKINNFTVWYAFIEHVDCSINDLLKISLVNNNFDVQEEILEKIKEK
jgi:hypothetical protein